MSKDVFIEGGLEEMEKLLKKAEVGHVALCDGSMPYAVPLNFLYYGGKIAFHCAWKGKKLDIIAKNPNCCFEVDKFMGEYRNFNTLAYIRPRSESIKVSYAIPYEYCYDSRI
jgi:hypothetical protein